MTDCGVAPPSAFLFRCCQTVEEGFAAAMNDANAKLAEDSMDVDGEQQAASAAAKKLKHLKDRVMPGGGDGS